MTFLVTYTEGHLGCFTVSDDGSLIQHALLDIGDRQQTPQQLVATALQLSKTYGWNGYVPKPIARKQPVAPVRKRTTKRPKYYGKLQPNEPLGNERYEAITNYLATNPNSNINDIVRGLGLTVDERITGRWSHYMVAMVNRGQLAVNKRNKPYTYALKGD